MKIFNHKITNFLKPLTFAMAFMALWLIPACSHSISHAATADPPAEQAEEPVAEADPAPAEVAEERPVGKILFIGDSMTGWMAERLNAYGDENGFEVSTVVWDGSTLPKWGKAEGLVNIIEEQKPDAIMVSLGMNDMFESRPEARFGDDLQAILNAFGDIPFLWVGPPSWPGHSEGEIFNDWLAERLGPGNYFRSDRLSLNRQSKSNPHPTRDGIEKWIDEVVEWIPENANFTLPGVTNPGEGKMTRGKTFIYKRMKENL